MIWKKNLNDLKYENNKNGRGQFLFSIHKWLNTIYTEQVRVDLDIHVPTGAIQVVVGLGSPFTSQWSVMSWPTRAVTGPCCITEGGPKKVT